MQNLPRSIVLSVHGLFLALALVGLFEAGSAQWLWAVAAIVAAAALLRAAVNPDQL